MNASKACTAADIPSQMSELAYLDKKLFINIGENHICKGIQAFHINDSMICHSIDRFPSSSIIRAANINPAFSFPNHVSSVA